VEAQDFVVLHWLSLFVLTLPLLYIYLLQQDNCDESDVQINAKLETNELHQSKIAEIIEYNNANSTRQFELVYKDYR
jgi:hypothetical protein